jgi:hypothetical protein
MSDWREPRVIQDDPRLDYIPHLLTLYRNMMIDADFNDDPSYPMWKQQYERIEALHKQGVEFEPKF